MDAQTAYNLAYAEAGREKVRPSTIGGMSDLEIAIEEKMNDMGFRRIPEFENQSAHNQYTTLKIKSIQLGDDGRLPPEEQW